MDKARRVGQVFGLAVAQCQAGEDTSNLEMALQAHPFDPTVELAKVITPAAGAGGAHQASLAGFFPVADGDVDDKVLFPGDEGIAQQAGNVIGDGAVDRILEVQHAQGGAFVHGLHQVAHHEVTVHIDAGGLQVVGHDLVKGLAQQGLLLVIQRELAVLGNVPVGKQLQFAAQQGFAVGGQVACIARFGGELPFQ